MRMCVTEGHPAMGRGSRQNVRGGGLLRCTLAVELDLGLTLTPPDLFPRNACTVHGMEDYKNQEFVLFIPLDLERVLHIEPLKYYH